MRRLFIAACLATMAAPAVASPVGEIRLPPQLSDPAMADRVGRVAEALVRAVMVMPVGEVQAAMEGRAATPADRQRTVRDVAGVGDPDFERRIAAEAAYGSRAAQVAAGAMVRALPDVLRSLEGAARYMDRALANLPRPDYPRR